MPSHFGAFCTDFYINQKLGLKLDVPTARETMLSFFERVRREYPRMDRLKRYRGEVALEGPEQDSQYNWVGLRRTTIRSGWVNPDSLAEALRLHRVVLECCPYYLGVNPLEVDFMEVMFGFDLEAGANRNEIVFEALFAETPLAGVIDPSSHTVLDAQPMLTFNLSDRPDLQFVLEIKTRSKPTDVAAGRADHQPISVFLTARRTGPLKTAEDFGKAFDALAAQVEHTAEERIVPSVLKPIREVIVSRPG